MQNQLPDTNLSGGAQFTAHDLVDLRICLDGWPFDAQQNVRVQRGNNGREIILVRRPMGLEQYELDGRPDGRQMHGMATALDFHHARITTARSVRVGALFELTPEECRELFDEAQVFHHRLVALFRLRDWPRAERDAVQILRLLDSIRQFASTIGDRGHLEPWRPHLQRIHAVARAMIRLEKRQYREIFQDVRDAAGLLEAFEEGAPDHHKIEQTLLASVQDSLEIFLTLPPPFNEETVFQRQKDYWKIQWQRKTALLKHSRGLQCLAVLLGSPGREFHVSELLASLLDSPDSTPVRSTGVRASEDSALCATLELDTGLAILDAQAKAEYKRRLDDLRQDLNEADQANDSCRAAAAQDEMNAIAHHLAAATGLGGRDRLTSSSTERARSAVTKRIKNAIQKIAEAIPPVGQHLAPCIKTGYYCSYHPNHAVVWKF